ncbi:MAG: DUF1700 domain-containing protein [Butyrivibrio sp.]|nr:DUF1700 domain-containing protein [Acetatifactor muris]MCM1559046.1 DUF1700 domain-containing protein [Butyrivibrio sp.]
MNRTEFMNQLETLFQNISDAEREEALQYYNDYFDDAGAENEQSVIEALGNPARVAENIRRELLENQTAVSSTAADRAVVEYGKADAREEIGEAPAVLEIGESRNLAGCGNGELQRAAFAGGIRGSQGAGGSGNSGGGGFGGASGAGSGNSGGGGFGGASGAGGGNSGGGGFGGASAAGGSGSFGGGGFGGASAAGGSGNFGGGGFGGASGAGGSGNSGGGGFGGASAAGGRPGSPGKQGMSGGMIVLITILLVFASPFIIGLLSILFGLLVMWFALILSFGVVVLSMFIVFFVLLIVGGMCIPADPLVGIALIGGGFVCGGVGILFLMLTVAMAGIVTPAIFKGIGHLFRFGRKEAAA